MAIDHFTRHASLDGHQDWNFNILFNDQPQVARMAKAYADIIDDPILYPPVPAKWLHMTMLRAGYTTEYTDDEMVAVAHLLKPRLASMTAPELTFGPSWIWEGGGIVLRIAPEGPINEILTALIDAMETVVGQKRTPKPNKFIPHMTLAYNRDYDSSEGLQRRLNLSRIDPAKFRAKSLSMIKQSQTPPFYRWKVIEDIAIGQDT